MVCYWVALKNAGDDPGGWFGVCHEVHKNDSLQIVLDLYLQIYRWFIDDNLHSRWFTDADLQVF